MVELRDRKLLIDGKPELVFAGEIHYYRLHRGEWKDRILKLKDLGCRAVASYIPWVVHEEVEGDIDVTGRIKPENDVAAFIDLCHAHGLWFLARPGPFVMAEMKNEGIPYWVYENHPEVIPVSFRGEKATTKTLDYLNANYLAAVERWYGAVMPIVAERLQPKGGPVIGVQLDNEIGMLQWVSNQPDLSDDVLCDFATWLGSRYGADQFASRYPFDLFDPASRAEALRNPKPEIGAALLRDYGDYERNRFARYVAKLRGFAEAKGIHGVPFIVNVHGSGGGRGTEFPIGIHQLYEAYTQAPGYWAGSDHYLGELTRDNAPDLYFLNAFMAAVNRPEQPLSSMEFEVGSGDYAETGAARMTGAAADFKVRLSVAQGNRLVNYYLLAGGHNPMLAHPRPDGNGRIAITGERHGFAAPIDPEGHLDPCYRSLQKTTAAVNAVADKLATMDEETDDLALAFLPDYYKTDFHIEGAMRSIVDGLRDAREPLATLTRGLLFLGYRFPAVDIQHREINPSKGLAFASSRFLDEAEQRKLVQFVEAGGRLLLFGDLPTADLEGKECLHLANAFGWKRRGPIDDGQHPCLSVQGTDWAAFEPEVRAWRTYTIDNPGKGTFLRIVGTDLACGATTSLGKGRAAYVGFGYPFHAAFYRALLAHLEIYPGIELSAPREGVLATTMANGDGERFANLINLDLDEKAVELKEKGKPLFDGSVQLGGKSAKLLPLDVRIGTATIAFATTELTAVHSDSMRFQPTGYRERILIEAARSPSAIGANVRREHGRYLLETQPWAEKIEVKL